MGDIQAEDDAITKICEQLVKKGDFKKVRRKGETYYSLTEKGIKSVEKMLA